MDSRAADSEDVRVGGDFSAYDGKNRSDVLDVLIRHREVVPVQHGDVRVIAHLDRSEMAQRRLVIGVCACTASRFSTRLWNEARFSVWSSARHPAAAIARRPSMPPPVNSPIPPLRIQSLPKNGNEFLSRGDSVGSDG